MRNFVVRLLQEYAEAKSGSFSGNPLAKYIRQDVPREVIETRIVDEKRYMIKASAGMGNWATIPWLCIFDREITNTAEKGVYVCYLLSADGERLYLTLNQGCSDLRKTHTVKDTIKIMSYTAEEIRQRLQARGFQADDHISLGSSLPELGRMYEKGTIFHTVYTRDQIPSEEQLRDDLSRMMEIYQDYARVFFGKDKEKIPVVIDTDDSYQRKEKSEMTVKEIIESIKQYIASKGFSYEKGVIENFYLSLKAKPFVILAGTSGTGKTRLIKLFAEAVGATTENGRYKMVSVRPDWSDSSDLFGHVNLNGKFVPGAILDFIKQAEGDLDHPYFLCLDEMNLARVEYYFSDVLSVMETRNFDGDTIKTDPLVELNYYGVDQAAAQKYQTIRLPENLYIIGTVNMDETTFPFSRKVLDRANTIEFSYVDLIPDFSNMAELGERQELPNRFLKMEYLLLSQASDRQEEVVQYCTELQKINQILYPAGAHVGYRVRDEIVFYLLNNSKAGLLTENEAMDNEIMQKILPRIQGSSSGTREMLCELFKECAGDYQGYQTNDAVYGQMIKALQENTCKYPKSAAKIAFMVRRFEEDGFTSYWL